MATFLWRKNGKVSISNPDVYMEENLSCGPWFWIKGNEFRLSSQKVEYCHPIIQKLLELWLDFRPEMWEGFTFSFNKMLNQDFTYSYWKWGWKWQGTLQWTTTGVTFAVFGTVNIYLIVPTWEIIWHVQMSSYFSWGSFFYSGILIEQCSYLLLYVWEGCATNFNTCRRFPDLYNRWKSAPHW